MYFEPKSHAVTKVFHKRIHCRINTEIPYVRVVHNMIYCLWSICGLGHSSFKIFSVLVSKINIHIPRMMNRRQFVYMSKPHEGHWLTDKLHAMLQKYILFIFKCVKAWLCSETKILNRMNCVGKHYNKPTKRRIREGHKC